MTNVVRKCDYNPNNPEDIIHGQYLMLMESLRSRNDGAHCIAVNCAVVVAEGQLLCQVGGSETKEVMLGL